jgi:hypothetical protein
MDAQPHTANAVTSSPAVMPVKRFIAISPLGL